VTSAFIIQVQHDLKQDPNDETTALLRFLIYTTDNTTFGGVAPPLPQWTGPPRTAVRVQCLLYASLATALLCAFLAMLGKQWLNRYASVGMRGSAIERSQNRQRKLDGIVAWYFDHVMESLPSMLQVALLLLGCALSRYLWEINTTVASVVIGVTSFGLLLYLFIVIAGSIFESCPYQMSGTSLIHGIVRYVVDLYRSAYALFVENSLLRQILLLSWHELYLLQGNVAVIHMAGLCLLTSLILFIIDVFRLGRATFLSFVRFARVVHGWLSHTPTLIRALNEQATESDLRCVSWMLRTSLDKTVNLSTLDYLGIILPPPYLDSATAVGCFNIFSNCVVVDSHHAATVSRGSERLAAMSAAYLLRALFRPSSAEPTPTATGDVLPRCKEAFPPHANLDCLPFIRVLEPSIGHIRGRAYFTWMRYHPSTDELVPFARAMAQVAQAEHHRREGRRPEIFCVLVRFALRFLSQDPLPPTSVVVDCLTIVATDLGCNMPDTNTVTPDEKCVYTPETTVSPLTPHQCAT